MVNMMKKIQIYLLKMKKFSFKKELIFFSLLLMLSMQGNAKDLLDVASGLYHTLFLFDDGSILSTGDNTYGQLGNGKKTQEGSDSTIEIVDSKLKFISVAAGYQHSLGITNEGILLGWGNNENSQLGKLIEKIYISPVKLSNERNWKKVFADGNSSFAIKNDGSLWDINAGFKEIKNPSKAKWKNLNIITYFFIDDFYTNIILEDENNEFWFITFSDEDSLSCFTFIQKINTDFPYLYKIDLSSDIYDFGMNSYSGYFIKNNGINLWGASITDGQSICNKYKNATSSEFYKWLIKSHLTINNKDYKRVINGSFFPDIYFLSELINKKNNENYQMLNAAYTLLLNQSGDIKLWTNGKQYKNIPSIRIEKVFGKYNLVVQSIDKKLYVIGYNFFNSLGVFSERSGNYTFYPDFMFLEPFNLSNPAEKNPKITNPHWENAGGQAITKALVGDEVYLCADVTDIADGTTAKIKIVEKDDDGNDDEVDSPNTKVQNGKIKCKWKVVYMEDNDDTESRKEMEEKGYTLPEYAFTVECDGEKSEESPQLDIKDEIEITVSNFEKLKGKTLKLFWKDGSSKEVTIDSEKLKISDVYIGKAKFQIL